MTDRRRSDRRDGPPALLDVAGLTIVGPAGSAVLRDVSFSLRPGERLGVLGESGAGKTTLALSLLGSLRTGFQRSAGDVGLGGERILAARQSRLRELRRRRISYLPQDPAASLTPTLRVREQVAELIRAGGEAGVEERLRAVELPPDREFQRRRPGQLSGGQRQRLALARALASDPELLVLDEPTTGLDPPVRDGILALLDKLSRERGVALVVVSHDLAALARLTERLLVLHDGRIVDRGATARVLSHCRDPHTAALVAASLDISSVQRRPPASGATVLEVRGLDAEHGRRGHRSPALKGISLVLPRGSCLAVIGASGSGKTTLARCLAGLHPPAAGTILLGGEPVAGNLRRRRADHRELVQLIPQDPALSLNPRRSVGASLAVPLRRLRGLGREAGAREAARLLGLVGLGPELAERRPGHLSGGECQRIAIARALAAQPEVLICDEITSSLDTLHQAAIVRLLDELKHRLKLAVVLICHDVPLVSGISDRVLVLDRGRAAEGGETGQVFGSPSHPATRRMLRGATVVERSGTTVDSRDQSSNHRRHTAESERTPRRSPVDHLD